MGVLQENPLSAACVWRELVYSVSIVHGYCSCYRFLFRRFVLWPMENTHCSHGHSDWSLGWLSVVSTSVTAPLKESGSDEQKHSNSSLVTLGFHQSIFQFSFASSCDYSRRNVVGIATGLRAARSGVRISVVFFRVKVGSAWIYPLTG